MMKIQGSQFNNISFDDFSQRILVVYRLNTRNSRGDIIEGAFRIRCRCFAKIYPFISKTIDDNSIKLKNEVIYRVIIRWRPDIKLDDFFIWRNKKLKIINPPIDIESRHIFLLFECSEVIVNGIQKS